jgi:hypothetical protein
MLHLHLYWKTQEEEMAVAQHVPSSKPTKALPTKHFELPDELRSSLLRASDLIRKRRAELCEDPLPTSLAGLDHLLGGGLPRGEMVELVGRGSCGRFAALLAALRAVTGAGEAAALVDQGAQLDPQAAAEIGIDLERLLWLRPQNLGDSLAAAELLVHTGFPLVVLDLGLPPVRGRAPLAAWLRLARNAATHQAVVLVGSPYRLSGCAAGVVVATWPAASAIRIATRPRMSSPSPRRRLRIRNSELGILNSRPPTPGLQHLPKTKERGEREMSQPFEMSTRGIFELAGEAFGWLLFGFCFLLLAFCV